MQTLKLAADASYSVASSSGVPKPAGTPSACTNADAMLGRPFARKARFHVSPRHETASVAPEREFERDAKLVGSLVVMNTSRQSLALYRQLLRAAGKFTNYNFRDYALRCVREDFRVGSQVADAAEGRREREAARGGPGLARGRGDSATDRGGFYDG